MCLHFGPRPMIFVATTFFHSVNLKQLWSYSSPSYFSAKQWNTLPDFFRTSIFADFKTKMQGVTFT